MLEQIICSSHMGLQKQLYYLYISLFIIAYHYWKIVHENGLHSLTSRK